MEGRSERRGLYLGLSVLLLAAVLATIPTPRAGAVTLTVNSTADTADAIPGNGVCDDGTGICTLRAAIHEANALAGVDTINFNIPGAGPHVIAVGPDPLPGIDEQIHIDGYSQPGTSANTLGFGFGSDAVIGIELDGSGVTNQFLCTGGAFERPGLCLRSAAGGSSVRGLSIHSFPGYGIRVIGSGNTVAGNFIGIDSAGTDHGNTFQGVFIAPFGTNSSANNNLIGGPAAADRNVISGNTQSGIWINGGGNRAEDNVIQNNVIGLDPTGTVSISNNTGVFVGANPGSGPRTTIDSNIISGNLGSGISFSSAVEGGVVTNNRIGTDPSGTIDLGNTGQGVNINTVCTGACTNGITIGMPGQGNLIAGNNNDGISISTGNHHTIQGNYIGTDVTGVLPLGNSATGVTIIGSGLAAGVGDYNTVGGPGAGEGNVISSNAFGVRLTAADNNLVEGNLIGVGSDGTTPLGNTTNGIRLGVGVDNNVFQANTIAYSGDDGYQDSSTGNASNLVTQNSIHSNGALGIDLTFNGVEVNDPGDPDTGANGNQNYPVLIGAIRGPGATEITGTLNSVANETFTIEFFSSPAADPSGFGEGAVYLGEEVVNTDGLGDAVFAAVVPTPVAAGHVITSTATDAANNTSEFSGAFAGLVVNQSPTITSDGAGAAAALNAAENQTSVTDVDATDPEGDTEGGGGLTFSLTGGADQALFTIDTNTGVLAFQAAPDFENTGDANVDGDYEVQVTVTDSLGDTDAQDITVTVTDENDPPTITTAATVNAPENQTAVTDVDATDQDGDTEGAGLSYSLTGGADQADFAIDANTGVLTFQSAPDFETPGDANTDNDYEVQVTVTDSGTATDVQDLTVTVTDVDELLPVVIEVNESITVTDTPTALLPVVIVVNEQIGVSDDPAVLPPVIINIGENVTVTDTPAVLLPVVIQVDETVTVADPVSVLPPVVINIDELVTVTDTPNVLPPVVIGIVESVTVTDQVTVFPPVVIDIDETVTVTDQVTVLPPVVIEVDESVTATDTATLLLPVVIAIGEDITVADTPAVTISDATVVDLDSGEPAGASPDGELLIEGSGFTPGSDVEITLFSDPVLLAVTTADSAGAISVLVTIPADTPPGDHTIVASEVGGSTELSAPLDIATLPGAPQTSAPAVAAGQYSDPITPIVVTASGFDVGAVVVVVAIGLPAALAVSACAPVGDGTSCEAVISGFIDVAAGSYPVAVHAIADGIWSEPAPMVVEVAPENATISSASRRIFRLVFGAEFRIQEAAESPDHPGDISRAAGHVTATRLFRGSPIELSCGSSFDGDSLELSCDTSVLRAGIYRLEATVEGGYFSGANSYYLFVPWWRTWGVE